MIEVEMCPGSEEQELVRSFAACLASVTETGLDEVPTPDADFRGAMAHWRSWLAGRGFGLAPLAQPRTFNWPGYWLAILNDDKAVLLFGTPSGVVLSPQDSSLLGRPARDLTIRDGFVLASLDARVPQMASPLPTLLGEVVVVAVATQPPIPWSRSTGLEQWPVVVSRGPVRREGRNVHAPQREPARV